MGFKYRFSVKSIMYAGDVDVSKPPMIYLEDCYE